jgi:hypothetical protein
MKALRFWVVALLGWFFLFYNVERLSSPINIASFVYVLTIVLGMLIILFPWLLRISLSWVLLIPMLLFFGLKYWLGYQIAGENLPITVTEICTIALTILLSRQIGLHIEEFRETISDVMIGHLKHLSRPFDIRQSDIYREVRRAREYEQPLALLRVSVADETVELSVDRFIKEMQQEMVKKYVAARLAQFLLKELKDYDIITQRDDHFITLLPGVSHKEVPEIVKGLESKAKEELGLTLKIGAATFPEEVTLEKLVESAEANIGAAPADNHQLKDVSASAESALSQEKALIR